jgi:hypothetical protein
MLRFIFQFILDGAAKYFNTSIFFKWTFSFNTLYMFHTTIENSFIHARQKALELWAWKITTRPTREYQVTAAKQLHTTPTSASYKVNKYAVNDKA